MKTPDYLSYDRYKKKKKDPSKKGMTLAITTFFATLLVFTVVARVLSPDVDVTIGEDTETDAKETGLEFADRIGVFDENKPDWLIAADINFEQFEGMTDAEGISLAIAAVKELSLRVSIPQRLREIGVKEEDIPNLAIAAFNDVCTGGNPRPTSVEEIEELYHTAF